MSHPLSEVPFSRIYPKDMTKRHTIFMETDVYSNVIYNSRRMKENSLNVQGI